MRTDIEMCRNCPRLPKSVLSASIVRIDVPDIHRLASFPLFHENHGLLRDVENTIVVTAQATEVLEGSDSEEGDVARLDVDGLQMSEEDVAQAFEKCPGPQKNLIQKILGTASCGAVR